MNRAIVDTDILSDLLRGKNPWVQRLAAAYLAEHERLTISALTVFEVVRRRHQAAQPERAADPSLPSAHRHLPVPGLPASRPASGHTLYCYV